MAITNLPRLQRIPSTECVLLADAQRRSAGYIALKQRNIASFTPVMCAHRTFQTPSRTTNGFIATMTHLPTDDMHRAPRTRRERLQRARHAAPAVSETLPHDAARTMPLRRSSPRVQQARAAEEVVTTTDTRHPRHTSPAGAARSARATTTARSTRQQGVTSADFSTYLTRTLAAVLFPGGGFVLAGLRNRPDRLRLGVIMASVYGAAALLLVVVALVMGPAKLVLAVASRTPLLLCVLLLHLVAVGVWCVSIVITGRDNRPAGVRLPHYLTVGWIGLLCTLLIAPTAAAAWVGHTTLSSMAGIHYDFGTKADGPNGTADNPWAGTPRVNVLLLGSDAGDDRYSFRTDAMMVASIDTTTGKTALFGIPRQLQGFTLRPSNPLYKRFGPTVTCSREQAGECMLNAMSVRAGEIKDQFPPEQQANAGVVTLTEILEDFLNLKISNTVVVQMRGLTDTVEALGGVNVNVKQRLPIGGRVHNNHVVPGSIHGWIEPGLQRLNGEQAKWYARSRATTDNDDRMNRQRCLVGALVKQITPAQIMANYGKLTQVLVDNIKTDIDLNPTHHNGLPAWLTLFDKVRSAGKITSVNFIDGKNINTTHPKYDDVHAIVRNTVDPAAAPAASSSPPTTSSQPATASSSTSTPTTSSQPPNDAGAATTAPANVDLAKGC